jgi:CRISPR-associated endonuclease/helicase Cas3
MKMLTPNYYALWAKIDRLGTGKVHLLIYHLIDVGQCTLALWKHALSPKTRQTFTGYLDMDEEAVGRLFSFWASLHDLGKAAPGFQRKHAPIIAQLREVGFQFPEANPQPAPHGYVTAWALEKLLIQEQGYSTSIAKKVGRALGGHHGTWPSPIVLQSVSRQIADTGDSTWDLARVDLMKAVQQVFDPPGNLRFPAEPELENALLALFSGLVSVTDWIGSMSEYFTYEDQYIELEDYARISYQSAENTLHDLGWIGWQAEGITRSFRDMFPFSSNDIQTAVLEAVTSIKLPALIILEAPTGSGKTEAALYLADTWLQKTFGSGFYIAMPTQATSNQMYGRVLDFIAGLYPKETINLQLAHGGALLSEAKQEPDPANISDDDASIKAGSVRAQSWFLPRKRSLLAPFGVGTVDQALLSVLQTRHFFVRLYGLSQKVVVFDEVHAYDTYMSVLFERLLTWLRHIGTTVILLSATLPEKTRQRLAAAWQGKQQLTLNPMNYPRMLVVNDQECRMVSLPEPESHTMRVDWIEADANSLVIELANRLENGGCAAIVCNRIARAQEIYEAIRDADIVDQEKLILFHARFPYYRREEIEKLVLNLFKKGGERPQKAVVVATQVIEQSLDLDFDFMISDLAPIDLLIQRAGRLHRHSINNDDRPLGLKTPVMVIAYPNEKDGIPSFGRDEYVYERSILLKTYLALKGRTSLSLPEEVSELVETVYGPILLMDDPVMEKAIKQAEAKAWHETMNEITEAKKRLIPAPDDEELLYFHNDGLEEEDPRIHEAFKALTRLADPSVSIICLQKDGEATRLWENVPNSAVDLAKIPDRDETHRLLRQQVNIQRKELVNHFSNQGGNPSWKEVAALRYHYPVVFNENGFCHFEGTSYTLILSRDTGLTIREEQK